MTFEPYTIQHLGIKMYSNLPTAMAELIANAYDADAKEVHIKLIDDGKGGKSIIVQDDGHGMSFDDVNDRFLKIGRNRREDGAKETPNGRTATGKKGLGKLAFFGIGETIKTETTQLGSDQSVEFTMNWDELRTTRGGPYRPKFEEKPSGKETQGTIITLTELKRKTPFDAEELATSLAKLFNFFDDNFKVFVSVNDEKPIEIVRESKYEGLDEQFCWEFPEFCKKLNSEYENKNDISGKIITTTFPLKPGLRGITLFANGRLVNAPEFFGSPDSSHFFSYTTGWLDVDFVDDWDDDVISTNRQSLDWDNEKLAVMREFLQETLAEIHREWRVKRKKENKKDVEENTDIKIDEWLSTVPGDKAESVRVALDKLSDPDTESTENISQIFTEAAHTIMPEYAELHWRYLHPAVHEQAKEFYVQKRYYEAAKNAATLYVQRVRDAAGLNTEKMDRIFNPGNGALMVTNCSNETETSIQTGHQHLSQGVVSGCRHPLVHNPEFEKHLVATGLFDEKVCLDMLAIISHLFTRLDRAKRRD